MPIPLKTIAGDSIKSLKQHRIKRRSSFIMMGRTHRDEGDQRLDYFTEKNFIPIGWKSLGYI